MGTLELGPGLLMAACTLRVDGLVAPGGNGFSVGLVHRMAGDAGDLVAAVTALYASGVGEGILMTPEADSLGFIGNQLGRISDVFGVGRLCVDTTRPVARFAGLALPVFAGRLHRVMPVPLERLEDILVARLAGFGTDVIGFCGCVFGRCGGRLGSGRLSRLIAGFRVLRSDDQGREAQSQHAGNESAEWKLSGYDRLFFPTSNF